MTVKSRQIQATRFTRYGLLAAALLLLAGCGIFNKKAPPPACPRVGILSDAAKGTVYRAGAGRDLTDVAYEHQLLDFNGGCKYTDKLDAVTVIFTLQVAATRGPAGAAAETSVPYFVAVVDKQQRILSRERFTAKVPFTEGRRRAVVGEELEQRIPFVTGRGAADVEILVGLELSPEQLESNRKARGF